MSGTATIANTKRGTVFPKEGDPSYPIVKTEGITASPSHDSKTHQWEKSQFIRGHHSGAKGIKAGPMDPHTSAGQQAITKEIKDKIPEKMRVKYEDGKTPISFNIVIIFTDGKFSGVVVTPNIEISHGPAKAYCREAENIVKSLKDNIQTSTNNPNHISWNFTC